jgi:3-hydroxyisobutyrate dehydrogenase
MLSLADQHVVEAMLFGDDGVFGSLREGGYVVDMSTVPPVFARELAAKAAETGYRAIDACVLGNPQHARDGELRVMVGGDEADFQAIEPILQTIGKDIAYLGANGMGATMKLVLNMLMGVQMPALAEAVVFGERAGLPRAKILEMIAASGYSSPVMKFRCGMMGRRAFQQAAFKLALMRKDMMLVLSESQELGVPLPVSESAYAMLTAASQQGLGDFDVAAILAFQERLSGMEDYPWPEPGAGPPAGVAGGPPPGVPVGGGKPPGRGTP